MGSGTAIRFQKLQKPTSQVTGLPLYTVLKADPVYPDDLETLETRDLAYERGAGDEVSC